MTVQEIRDRILASVAMLTEEEIPTGCQGQGLCFEIDGHPRYPRFQYNVEQGCMLPVMTDILELQPDDWSDLRVLEWLTRPHLDFGCAPCDALADLPREVLAAFKREIVPPTHG
ncbi:hypothetical protein [Ruegeria atlantica]|uniref:hypothetical protein n=1 Tax=Ruegeria atlantica TaxID=81569 RepID=UPI002494D6ED|nr:hypothetical protein [Ruegeria atlantica]